MNKLFVCLLFCTLNSFAMHGGFWDSLSPEKVVNSAMESLFSGPLPIITRADVEAYKADREKKESQISSVEAAEKEKQLKKIQLRRLISLNEAIRLGAFVAIEDEEKGKIIKFEDFETTPKLRLAPFYATLSEVNSQIYTTLTEAKHVSDASPLAHAEDIRNKILTYPDNPLTEEEYLTYQTLHIIGFLTNEDLNQFRIHMIEHLQTQNVANDEKQKSTRQIEMRISNTMMFRAAYLAAFASQNIAAINIERKGQLYPSSVFLPLKTEITELRQQGRDARAATRAMLRFDPQAGLVSATESALRMYHEYHEA